MKNDNAIQPLDDQDSPVATADPEETEFNKPPEDHRIRVDANDDLTQNPGESDGAFNQRKREYETAPDPFSPTGRKKSKIYLYDFDVKCIGTKTTTPRPARIEGVPAASDAIREFMILRGIKHAAGFRFRAFVIPGTKRDAGDAGYASNHVPDEVRKRRVANSL